MQNVPAGEASHPPPDARNGPSVLGRLSSKPRLALALGVGGVAVAALCLTWSYRGPLVGTAGKAWLDSRGIPSSFTVEAVDPSQLRLKDLRLGGTSTNPDLTADELLVSWKWFAPWDVRLARFEAQKLVVNARMKDGVLSLGALDEFGGSPRRPRLDDPDVQYNLPDAQLNLAAEWGMLSARAQVSGAPRAGLTVTGTFLDGSRVAMGELAFDVAGRANLQQAMGVGALEGQITLTGRQADQPVQIGLLARTGDDWKRAIATITANAGRFDAGSFQLSGLNLKGNATLQFAEASGANQIIRAGQIDASADDMLVAGARAQAFSVKASASGDGATTVLDWATNIAGGARMNLTGAPAPALANAATPSVPPPERRDLAADKLELNGRAQWTGPTRLVSTILAKAAGARLIGPQSARGLSGPGPSADAKGFVPQMQALADTALAGVERGVVLDLAAQLRLERTRSVLALTGMQTLRYANLEAVLEPGQTPDAMMVDLGARTWNATGQARIARRDGTQVRLDLESARGSFDGNVNARFAGQASAAGLQVSLSDGAVDLVSDGAGAANADGAARLSGGWQTQVQLSGSGEVMPGLGLRAMAGKAILRGQAGPIWQVTTAQPLDWRAEALTLADGEVSTPAGLLSLEGFQTGARTARFTLDNRITTGAGEVSGVKLDRSSLTLSLAGDSRDGVISWSAPNTHLSADRLVQGDNQIAKADALLGHRGQIDASGLKLVLDAQSGLAIQNGVFGPLALSEGGLAGPFELRFADEGVHIVRADQDLTLRTGRASLGQGASTQVAPETISTLMIREPVFLPWKPADGASRGEISWRGTLPQFRGGKGESVNIAIPSAALRFGTPAQPGAVIDIPSPAIEIRLADADRGVDTLDARAQGLTLALGAPGMPLRAEALKLKWSGPEQPQIDVSVPKLELAQKDGAWTGNATGALANLVVRARDGSDTFRILTEPNQLDLAFSSLGSSVSAKGLVGKLDGEGLPTLAFSVGSTDWKQDAGPGVRFTLALDEAQTKSAQLPFVGKEIRARLSGTMGKNGLELDVSELTGLADDATGAGVFAPIRANAEGKMRQGQMTLTGLARLAVGGPKLADLELTHNLVSGKGQLRADAPRISFNPRGLQPAMLSPMLRGVLADATGLSRGDALIAWEDGKVVSTGSLTFEKMGFSTLSLGPVDNVNGTIRFEDLFTLTSAPDQLITIERMNPGLPITDGRILLRVQNGGDIAIAQARWPFLDGALVIEPVVWASANVPRREVALGLENVSIASLVQLLDVPGLSANGRLTGRVPIVFEGPLARIEQGLLHASADGGTISYTGTAKDAAAQQGYWSKFTFDALQNLQFELMELGIEGELGGKMIATIHVLGSNAEVLDPGKIDFRLKVDAELPKLLRNLGGIQNITTLLGDAARPAGNVPPTNPAAPVVPAPPLGQPAVPNAPVPAP